MSYQLTPGGERRHGDLRIGEGCRVHPTAVFLHEDMLGTTRPIVLGARCVVGPYAVMHGGTRIGSGVVVGAHTVVGEPEYGYAVRELHAGAGASTVIGDEAILRGGAIIYAGVQIGARTTIGHHTLLRTAVHVGADSQLAANLTVERGSRIGDQVRCSPGSHITADTVIDDHVFIGAGVRTVNDKQLIWRDPQREQPLAPPRFHLGCKVGSGAVIAAGVVVGRYALVGSGSVVTRDVAPGCVVYGVPARAHGQATR